MHKILQRNYGKLFQTNAKIVKLLLFPCLELYISNSVSLGSIKSTEIEWKSVSIWARPTDGVVFHSKIVTPSVGVSHVLMPQQKHLQAFANSYTLQCRLREHLIGKINNMITWLLWIKVSYTIFKKTFQVSFLGKWKSIEFHMPHFEISKVSSCVALMQNWLLLLARFCLQRLTLDFNQMSNFCVGRPAGNFITFETSVTWLIFFDGLLGNSKEVHAWTEYLGSALTLFIKLNASSPCLVL